MIKFIENDKNNYEVRVTNGSDYDWEVAGNLVRDEDGIWSFEDGDESVEYEDSLEETEAELEEEFEDGKTDYMSLYFGKYKYNK